jgi:hypothetical protein
VLGRERASPTTYSPTIFRDSTSEPGRILNGDDIAQENEIGPTSNLSFGVRRNQNPDPDISRPYQLVWDAGIQHEVFRGLGLTVSYNRRRFIDNIWTENLALESRGRLHAGADSRPTRRGDVARLHLAPSKLGLVNLLDSQLRRQLDLVRRRGRDDEPAGARLDAAGRKRPPGGRCHGPAM